MLEHVQELAFGLHEFVFDLYDILGSFFHFLELVVVESLEGFTSFSFFFNEFFEAFCCFELNLAVDSFGAELVILC